MSKSSVCQILRLKVMQMLANGCDVVLDPRFLLPSHFRIVNKVTVLNGVLKFAYAKNWDHTAIGMYRTPSQLIRRMYSINYYS